MNNKGRITKKIKINFKEMRIIIIITNITSKINNKKRIINNSKINK
jgi:hypothetical protein